KLCFIQTGLPKFNFLPRKYAFQIKKNRDNKYTLTVTCKGRDFQDDDPSPGGNKPDKDGGRKIEQQPILTMARAAGA
ncbi:MAG: hypothetical protein R3B41_00005, partial [Candidatus Doudnabacteria bacterium]